MIDNRELQLKPEKEQPKQDEQQTQILGSSVRTKLFSRHFIFSTKFLLCLLGFLFVETFVVLRHGFLSIGKQNNVYLHSHVTINAIAITDTVDIMANTDTIATTDTKDTIATTDTIVTADTITAAPTMKRSKMDDIPTNEISIKLSSKQRKSIYRAAFPTNDKIMDRRNKLSYFEENINTSIPVPHDLDIVFLGDSLTRYQYIDLAYFLSHNGSWVGRKDSPCMTYQGAGQHDSWKTFFNSTNTKLKPYEQCDCFRSNSIMKTENRYFYEPVRNNRIRFLLKWGDDFHSSWDPLDVHNDHGPLNTNTSNYKPVYYNYTNAITDFVCKLHPKPNVFVFNEGKHEVHPLIDVRIQAGIVKALKECDIISIFKTTTKSRKENDDRKFDLYEVQLCNQTDMCLNTKWTGALGKPEYWDHHHLRPHIYPWLNIQMLSMLAFIEDFPM